MTTHAPTPALPTLHLVALVALVAIVVRNSDNIELEFTSPSVASV